MLVTYMLLNVFVVN